MTEKPKKRSPSAHVDEGLTVAAHQQRQLVALVGESRAQARGTDQAIASSEALLISLGRKAPVRSTSADREIRVAVPIELRPWAEVLADAEAAVPGPVEINSLLSPEEIALVVQRHKDIGKELYWSSSFDRYDWALSVAAGLLAGIVDVLLVGVPAHTGFMGSKGASGGHLSNAAKNLAGKVLPPDKIRALEKAYGVSFDPSTNVGLDQAVSGLNPRTHRFQSLGHDPILGFIFGVRDIMNGDFSAIGKDGRLIIQHVGDPIAQGEALIVRLLEALKMQLGHLASDVATPSGLPAPLMSLLSFLQVGTIGKQGYTVGEIARLMYAQGYDLRHFAATSVPLLISELIVRLGYFARAIHVGKTLKEAMPSASAPKLRRQLLLAHSVAMMVNAGKVYFTKNPLAISWAQVLTVLRYLIPEVGFLIFGAEAARSDLVERELLAGYDQLLLDVDRSIASIGEIRLII